MAKQPILDKHIHIGRINPQALLKLRRALLRRKQYKEIILNIDSLGGDMYSLFGMLDLLNHISKSKSVITFCSSRAFSAGAALLIAAPAVKRIMAPQSTIMIHPVQIALPHTDSDLLSLQNETKETKRLQDQMFNLISKHSSLSTRKIKSLIQKEPDLYLSPRQARDYGLIDEIGYAP